MEYPKSQFTWKGTTITNYWIKTTDIESFSPITQVYGIVFNEHGEILVCRESSDGKWQIPGGTPEEGESLVQTLEREILEEVDTQVIDIHPLGVFKVEYPNNPNAEEGDLFYQSRFIAMLGELKDQTPDPATGNTWERRFVPANEITDYVDWGETGKAMFEDAIRTNNNLTSENQ